MLGCAITGSQTIFGFFYIQPRTSSIRRKYFRKAFTKRKQEYSKGSSQNVEAVQKKLADPITQVCLRFIAFLSVLFPSVFEKGRNVTNGFVKQLNLSLSPSDSYYKRTGILII